MSVEFMLYRIQAGRAMCLFLILFSRFVEIYSRLGGREFPIKAITGICSQVLGWTGHFSRSAGAIREGSKKFPVRRQKPATLPATEDWLPF
jgi:hypothetical protein